MVENINNQIETPEADAWQKAVDAINNVPVGDPALEKLINETFPTPESRSEENMENIYKFALENGISPYMILAYGYNENIVSNDIQATETRESKNAPTSFNITWRWRVYQEYEQIGKIENNVMTWAVLDFTWSMKKVQIESMIKTFLALNEKWIITPQTKISVMYDIADQDDEWENSHITVDKMKDTDAKTQSISFGEGWEGLKNYLQSKGLVDSNWNVLESWLWSTPLYSTILNNLMNSTVRESTVFTDGASDRSKNQAIWPEELWNTEAWDAMIHLCKNFDKSITIVAFNMKDEYMTRTEAMRKYFEENGAKDYLTIVNLGEIKDDELAQKLTENMMKKYNNISIKEDPDMINGKKLKIDVNWKKPDVNDRMLNTPKITNNDVVVQYNKENNTYNLELQKIFPWVDLSKYNIEYSINSYNQIESRETYGESTFNSTTWILDVSSSMATLPKESAKAERFSTNPWVSFEELLKMQTSILKFEYDGKFQINKIDTNISDYEEKKISFENPNVNLSGLILKSRIQRYRNLAETDLKNQPVYEAEIQKTQEYLRYIHEKNFSSIEINNVCKDEVNQMTEERKWEVVWLYKYIYSLEHLVAWETRTPIIQAFWSFSDPEFAKEYSGQTVNFLTDFWENESKGALAKLHKKVGEEIGWFWKYKTAYIKLNNTTQKDDEAAKKEIKRLDDICSKIFEDSDVVSDLQKNLLDNNIKIEFVSEWTIMPDRYFLSALGDYINQKAWKELITFRSIENKEDLFVPPEISTKQNPYVRESVTVKLTNKENPQDVLTSTVAVK